MKRYRPQKPMLVKMIWLVLFSFVPTLFLIVYLGYNYRKETIINAENLLIRSLLEIAGYQEALVVEIEEMLRSIAARPAVKELDTAAVNTILAEVKAAHPLVNNIILMRADGTVLSSVVPVPAQLNLVNTKYFIEAKKNEAFSAGEYTVSRTTHKPVFHFAYPVLDDNNALVGVLSVSLDIDRYGDVFDALHLPENSFLSIFDHNMVMLARVPQDEALFKEGRKLSEKFVKKINTEKEIRTFVDVGSDGIKKIYAFKRLRLDDKNDPYLYILMGIPFDMIMKDYNRRLLYAFGVSSILLITSVVVTIYTINRFIVSKIYTLSKYVDKFAKQKEVLPQFGWGNDEIGVLANTITDMSREIVSRTRELALANNRLGKEKNRLEKILDSLPVGAFIIKKKNYEVVFLNDRAFALFGLPDRDIIGKDCFDYFCKFYFASRQEVASEETDRFVEREFVDASGNKLQLIKSTTQIDIDGEELLVESFVDVTEQKQLENIRSEVERIIRHDLRSPLIGLIAAPQMLLKATNLTEKQRDLLKIIEISGRKLLSTLNMSLEMYKIETGKYVYVPAEVDLVKLLKENLSYLSFLHNISMEEIEITINGRPVASTAEDVALVVKTDNVLIDLILMNLIKNAFEASGERTRIALHTFPETHRLAIAVHNDRPVPETLRDKFFEKYATSGKAGGTGLGTYSACIMAKALGGDIAMESSQARGTTVTVTLPLSG